MKYALNFIQLLSSQTKKTQIAIAAVCMLLGILLATQLRVQQSASQVLHSASESDLIQIVSKLSNEVNTLKAEAYSLQLQLFKIERISNDSAAVMEDSIQSLNNLKIIAGLTKVRGPGVEVQVQDENRALNAVDIYDIITELRVGGADAISINGVRVVASTGVTQGGRAVVIDGKRISPPYELLAIGRPDVLHEALAIAGGVRDKLSSLEGVTFIIKKEQSLQIDSLARTGSGGIKG